MERSSAMKRGIRLMATGFFLAAALVCTGCGENALMNPASGSEQEIGSNPAGNTVNPAGNTVNPAGNTVNP